MANDPILELAREIVTLQLDWIKNVDQEWYAHTPVDKLDEAEASEIVKLLRSRLRQVGWAHSFLCSTCDYDPHGRKENVEKYWSEPGLTRTMPTEDQMRSEYDRFLPVYTISEATDDGKD